MRALAEAAQIDGASAQIGISRTAQMEQLKYAAIIVSVLPILFIYPFIQKYFVKGVSVGAVKEKKKKILLLLLPFSAIIFLETKKQRNLEY